MKTLRKIGAWIKETFIAVISYIANFVLHVGEFIWDIVLIVIIAVSD